MSVPSEARQQTLERPRSVKDKLSSGAPSEYNVDAGVRRDSTRKAERAPSASHVCSRSDVQCAPTVRTPIVLAAAPRCMGKEGKSEDAQAH